jgi:membrane protease YdiL (CAAX protease family)
MTTPPAPTPDDPRPATDAPPLDAPGPDAATGKRALIAAAGTTAVVTAVSWIAPDKHAATLVGLAFLTATWWLVVRHDEAVIRAHGLSLGGVLEPVALDPRRAARDALVALGWAALCALVFFPPFWVGWRVWWHASAPFHFRPPASIADDVAGQLLVIALPEEAFFRGYLQTELDRAWRPRLRVLGADVGPGLVVSAAIFAVGHLLTTPHPSRLAVFFPALVFGWLRARTGGVGAGVVFHAMCNLFSATLGRGYGLGS